MCCTQTEFKPHDLAAACWSCRASRSRPGYCGDSGATIADVTIGGRPCPRGKHPTARRPTFGWMGARWRGVPMPVRWAIAARGGMAPGDFTGCGCLDWLKALAERIFPSSSSSSLSRASA